MVPFASRRVVRLLLIGIALVAPACASRTEVPTVDVEGLRGNLKYDRVVFNEFTADPEVENASSALSITRDASIHYLDEKNLFKSVGVRKGGEAAGTLVVDARLTAMRIVSGGARFWGGAFAGRSYMNYDVKLTDAATGRVVEERALEGAPNAYGSAWSGGSSDRALPASMGQLIGEFVLSHAGKSPAATTAKP